MAIIKIGTNRKATTRHHLRPKRTSIEEQNKSKKAKREASQTHLDHPPVSERAQSKQSAKSFIPVEDGKDVRKHDQKSGWERRDMRDGEGLARDMPTVRHRGRDEYGEDAFTRGVWGDRPWHQSSQR